MKDYIHMFPNKHADEFNRELIDGTMDTPIPDLIIMAMREFECVQNIEILSTEVIEDQDLVDINEHSVNINFKRKRAGEVEIPKNKNILKTRCGEIRFTIRVKTNLNEKTIVKKILFPMKDRNGYYVINGRKMRAIWQLVDASTYSQRGRITFKSRMPIIIYSNKNRPIQDYEGNIFTVPSYSYAVESKAKGSFGKGKSGKKTTKFYNPFLIYGSKMGITQTIDFFGCSSIISIVKKVDEDVTDLCYFFPLNDLYIQVFKDPFNSMKYVQSVVCMLYNLASKDFPVTAECLDSTSYWISRTGYQGSIKSSARTLQTFYEKGLGTIYMVERLLDNITERNLRLPEIYKSNIYHILFWMITNYDELKKRNNIDMKSKRIRKNEYIVFGTLGKKINENLNRLIEKRGNSKMNTLDTLLELFNFNSDIIISGMKSMGDLIKSDEIVNDMTFLTDVAYSSKGPSSLGETSSKAISAKYRHLHPSHLGVVDLNTTSNSDVGMSGSIVPFVKLYDGFYFDENREPCTSKYNFEMELVKLVKEKKDLSKYIKLANKKEIPFDKWILKENPYTEELTYFPIEIIEKEATVLPD